MSGGQDGLPNGWVRLSLAEVGMPATSKIEPGAQPDALYELWSVPNFPNGPEYLLGKEVRSSKQVVQPDDVLLCKINPRINRVEVVGLAGKSLQIASTEWIVVRSKLTLPSYLRAALAETSFRQRLLHDVSGVGGSLMRARPKSVASIMIPIAPINEQERIVAKVEALQARSNAAREALDAIPPLLEKFRQSVLAAAFRGDLTKAWRQANPDVEPASELLARIRAERRRRWEEAKPGKKYKEPDPVNTEGLPELPEGWCWASVEELSEFVTSGSRGWGSYYSEDGPLFIRVGNLNRNTIALDLSNRAHVLPPPGAEGERTRVQTGDVLISITADVGMVGVVPDGLGPAFINQHVALVRLIGGVSARCFGYSLTDPSGLQSIVKEIQYGATKASLSLVQVRSFPVPLPPADEQVEIESSIDRLLTYADGIEAGLTTSLAAQTSLNQSILAKAFRGELVPQDPRDEPASVLLERIREERVAGEGKAGEGKGKGKTKVGGVKRGRKGKGVGG